MEKDRRILFVCHGNIFRSAFAQYRLEALLRERGLKGYAVRSAGTRAKPGDPSAPVVVEVAREYGLDMSGHRARPVSAEDLAWAERIYIMEAGMRQEVNGETEARVRLLGELAGEEGAEIPDIGPDPNVEAAVRDRFERIDRLLEHLLAGEA